MQMTFDAIDEDWPGDKWLALFRERWPVMRDWYLSEGEVARPSLAEARKALAQHMPELMPIYERLCELVDDELAARCLSGFRQPPVLSACSQVVWPGEPPVLIRNYDFSPGFCSGMVMLSRWRGRRVLAMGEAGWGLLDGMNEDGLVVSLTFGGRFVQGDGFNMPLILRFVLETCTTTQEAVAAIGRLPPAMAQNVTIVDRAGEIRTLLVSPDRAAVVLDSPIATNHQLPGDDIPDAARSRTFERAAFLQGCRADPARTLDGMIAAFLEPPLYRLDYETWSGSLYTAVYRPHEGTLDLLWPDDHWRQSFAAFAEGRRVKHYPIIRDAATRRMP